MRISIAYVKTTPKLLIPKMNSKEWKFATVIKVSQSTKSRCPITNHRSANKHSSIFTRIAKYSKRLVKYWPKQLYGPCERKISCFFFFFRSKTSTWRDENLKRTRKSGVLERRNKTHKYRLLLVSLRLLFSFLRKSLLRGCVRGIASIKHRRVIKHHGFRVCRESAFYISRLCAWSCEIRPWTVSLERKELRSIKFCRRQSRISAVVSVEFRKWI